MELIESGCKSSSDWYFIIRKNNDKYNLLSKNIIYSNEELSVGIFNYENIMIWSLKYRIFVCEDISKLENYLKNHDYVAVNLDDYIKYNYMKKEIGEVL